MLRTHRRPIRYVELTLKDVLKTWAIMRVRQTHYRVQLLQHANTKAAVIIVICLAVHAVEKVAHVGLDRLGVFANHNIFVGRWSRTQARSLKKFHLCDACPGWNAVCHDKALLVGRTYDSNNRLRRNGFTGASTSLCRRTWCKRDKHVNTPIMRLKTDFHGERTGNERTVAYLLEKMGYPCAT